MKTFIGKLLQEAEEGHAYAYGGGGILTVLVVILLLIWLF